MGRPINKRYLGEPTPAGTEIKVQFHNGTGSVNGWIVRQRGSKRFLCSDGTDTALCTLVPKASGDLLAGEMSITVKDDAEAVHQVTKISANRVTLETGDTMAWSWSDSLLDGYVEMEEGGSDDSFTDSDDFESDTTDTTGPVLTSLVAAAGAAGEIDATVSTNEANGTLYYVATVNATENAATIKAGSSQAVTASGEQVISVTGLVAGNYYLHVIQTDAATNDSNILSSTQITVS